MQPYVYIFCHIYMYTLTCINMHVCVCVETEREKRKRISYMSNTSTFRKFTTLPLSTVMEKESRYHASPRPLLTDNRRSTVSVT